MRAKTIICALFSLILLGVSHADIKFPSYSGFVNDHAGILSPAEKSAIEARCRDLEAKTSAELAVAVIKTSAPLDPKTYSVKLFEKWGIGKKGKDNGVLLLLAMDEKRVEIEIGYGLEGVITDARAGAVLDDHVLPHFRQGRFGEGLLAGAARIEEIIAKTHAGEEVPGERSAVPKMTDDVLALLVIVSLVTISILSVFGSGIAAGVFGGVVGAIFGLIFFGITGLVVGAVFGFGFAFINFKASKSARARRGGGFWGGFGGGRFGGGGFGGGGFGGFGGGRSGGGGAGRGW